MAEFSTTNLKYIQVLGSDQPRTAVVRRLFDAVTNLVVIDVEEDECESLRWVRGFGVPIVIKNFDDDDCWRHWWERPGKDVEDICKLMFTGGNCVLTRKSQRRKAAGTNPRYQRVVFKEFYE